MIQYRVPFYKGAGDHYSCPISSSSGHTFVFTLSIVDLHQVPESQFGIRFTDNHWFQITIFPPTGKISIYSSANSYASFSEDLPFSLNGETNLVIRIHKTSSTTYQTFANRHYINSMEGPAAGVAEAQLYQFVGSSRSGATFAEGKYRGATLTIFGDPDSQQKAEWFAQVRRNPDAEVLKLV